MRALSVLGSRISEGECSDSEGVKSDKLEKACITDFGGRASEGARYCGADLQQTEAIASL